jgi:hypothetical protein
LKNENLGEGILKTLGIPKRKISTAQSAKWLWKSNSQFFCSVLYPKSNSRKVLFSQQFQRHPGSSKD